MVAVGDAAAGRHGLVDAGLLRLERVDHVRHVESEEREAVQAAAGARVAPVAEPRVEAQRGVVAALAQRGLQLLVHFYLAAAPHTHSRGRSR